MRITVTLGPGRRDARPDQPMSKPPMSKCAAQTSQIGFAVPGHWIHPARFSPATASLAPRRLSLGPGTISAVLTVTPWGRPVALVGIADRQRAAVWDKRAQDNLELALPIASSHALLGKTSGHVAPLWLVCPGKPGRTELLLQVLTSCPPAQPQHLEPETGNNFHHGNPPHRITATAARDGQHCTVLCSVPDGVAQSQSR